MYVVHRLNNNKLIIIKSMKLPYKSLFSISKWYPYVYLYGNILLNASTPVLCIGIESLPLVDRLFADLLHTTESLKNSKLSTARSPRERADIESQIEPYKVCCTADITTSEGYLVDFLGFGDYGQSIM